MKLTKWCLLLLMVVLLLALPGCGSAEGDDTPSGESPDTGEVDEETGDEEPAGEEPEEEEEETAAPANDGVSISVTPPEGWEKMEQSSALAAYSKLGATFMVTRDIVPQEVNGYDGYIEFVKGKFHETFDEIEITGVENVTIDGHDGRKMTYILEMMGVEMKGEVYYIIKDGYAYTLTCGALADEFPSLEADFAQFLQSFKFE